VGELHDEGYGTARRNPDDRMGLPIRYVMGPRCNAQRWEALDAVATVIIQGADYRDLGNRCKTSELRALLPSCDPRYHETVDGLAPIPLFGN
jgi:hypothetical protein